MKVILAKTAGFCMGVRRAVDATMDLVKQGMGEIHTLGPLIHNPQVLQYLREHGVDILTDIPEKVSGTIIIRAHGVPPLQEKKLVESGAMIKNATCPRVIKVQVIIKKYRQQDYFTVIIGDKNHAEVDGLLGHADSRGIVVSNEEDVAALQISGPYIIVSQTTQDRASFARLSDMILEKFSDGRVFNTICDSTSKRQDEVRKLCGEVEAMIVVGGRSSANTGKTRGQELETLYSQASRQEQNVSFSSSPKFSLKSAGNLEYLTLFLLKTM
ncbi:MAG TPA: 4-hydroxy-3-methylbut-2-enyl diphosphate reductase [Desulfobacterales bacterium]|nr:4-hydroxy-3-methylbut-2-enyl diphosphate reductase [Desulfobacterales bacterium]